MPRPPRELKEGYCYHVTTRCNNREFRLTSWECRKVFLYAICESPREHQRSYPPGSWNWNLRDRKARATQILHLAVETAATQTKPAYAGYKTLDFWLVRAGGLGLYSPRIPF